MNEDDKLKIEKLNLIESILSLSNEEIKIVNKYVYFIKSNNEDNNNLNKQNQKEM